MLTAVKSIGESIRENSQNNDPINMLIKTPKLNNKKEKHYRLQVIFNLISEQIEFQIQGEYSENIDNREYLYIGIPDRQGKRFYPSFSFDKIQMLLENNIPDIKAKIEEVTKDYKDNRLWQIADLFTEKFYEKKEKGKPNLKPEILEKTFNIKEDVNYGQEILKKIDIGSNSEIILAYIAVKFNKNGEEKTEILAKMPEFEELLLKINKSSSGKSGYCYVCKEQKELIDEISFDRATVNQIFTTTTINYSSGIDGKNYYKNFQICQECFEDIKRSGNYIKDNLKITIAGIPSYVIPQFLVKTNIDYENEMLKIHSVTKKNFDGRDFSVDAELATDSNEIREFSWTIQDIKEDNLPYMLNFVSYDTDGNYFKIVNHIKDVPKFHFINVVEVINEEHKSLVQKVKKFNLGSIYGMIPIESKDAKKNKILSLYSNILTGTKIDEKVIFKYFTEFISCHKYQRKTDNIYLHKGFDFAIRDGIFKYLILINAIKRLKLFFEEENMNATEEKEVLDFENGRIKKEEFVKLQGFNPQQEALFYLGDILAKVAYAQYQAGYESKPVLNKITYQGMSVKEVGRLFDELFEKLKQYNRRSFKFKLNQAGSSINKFKELFDRNIDSWKLSEEQNVFYILSGYAFNVGNKYGQKDKPDILQENEEEILNEEN